MDIKSLNHFIDSFTSTDWSSKNKLYLHKNNDNNFKIVNTKKDKNLNTEEIINIVNECFNNIHHLEQTGNEILLLENSLHSFAKKIAGAKPWWIKILVYFGLYRCPVQTKISNLAKKFLDLSNHQALNWYDFKGKDIRQIALHDSQIADLFERCEKSSELSQYLSEMPKDELKKLIVKINQSFCDFLEWMNAIQNIEKNEQNENLKCILLKRRSFLTDQVYGKYAKFIHSITSQCPQIFSNKIRPNNEEASKKFKEKYPTTDILPEGTRMLIKNLQKNGLFSGECSVYDSYNEYGKEVAEKIKSDGKYYSIIRCKEPDNEESHQVAIYFEKSGDQMRGVILDCVLNPQRLYMVERISDLTRQAFPQVEINSTHWSRQCDSFNCSVIAIEDTLAFSGDAGDEIMQLCQNSEPIRKHVETASESQLKIVQRLPLALFSTMQSGANLKLILENSKKNPPEGFAELQRLQQTYTILDPDLNKEVYAYTKLMGNKYRLQIIEDAFRGLI